MQDEVYMYDNRSPFTKIARRKTFPFGFCPKGVGQGPKTENIIIIYYFPQTIIYLLRAGIQ
jgi:hypothetical protein